MNNWSQTAQRRGFFLVVGGIMTLFILYFADATKAMIALSITTTIAGAIGVADKGDIKPENLIKSLDKVDLMVNPSLTGATIVALKKPD